MDKNENFPKNRKHISQKNGVCVRDKIQNSAQNCSKKNKMEKIELVNNEVCEKIK